MTFASVNDVRAGVWATPGAALTTLAPERAGCGRRGSEPARTAPSP